MRAKSEIFSVCPKTFRTKVQTFVNKEEKKIVNALYGPHLPIKEDIPGSALGEVTVNTEKRRIQV